MSLLLKINTGWYTFFSIFVGSRRLNGIWIDYIITTLLFFFLNIYNFWLLNEPHKIYQSKTTKTLIRQYKNLEGESEHIIAQKSDS